MSDRDDDRDKKLVFSCERGASWRTFKRDFLAVARGKFAKDDRFSFRTAAVRCGSDHMRQGPLRRAEGW